MGYTFFLYAGMVESNRTYLTFYHNPTLRLKKETIICTLRLKYNFMLDFFKFSSKLADKIDSVIDNAPFSSYILVHYST